MLHYWNILSTDTQTIPTQQFRHTLFGKRTHMFNLSPEEVEQKIQTLSFDDLMMLKAGVTLDAALLIQRLFPDDQFVNWFIEMKKIP